MSNILGAVQLLKKGNCKVFDNSDQIAWLFYRSCSMLCC
nr:MAG TPA: hypothetical protein [Caudoviricetes sp.]